jgi:hypothetical protein
MITQGADPEGLSQPVGPGWQRLPRAAALALDLRKLVIAALGLLLLQGGWSLLRLLIPGSADQTPDLLWPTAASSWGVIPPDQPGPAAVLRWAGWELTEPWRVLTNPLLHLAGKEHRGWSTIHALLAILWAVAVWGLVGGAIARSALIDLTRGDGPRTLRPLRFAVRFAGPLIATPLYPLLAAGLFALICAGFGLLYWLPLGIGPVLGGVLHFIPLALGLVMTILLAGMVAAWPLMHASVAAECEDTLDALSRSFSYIKQRTARFVAYVAVCGLVGVPSLIVVDLLSRVVPYLAAWGLSLAAPASARSLFDPSLAAEPASAGAAVLLAGFWRAAIVLLRRSWVYVYFWTSAATIYLLLRNDVDGTAWSRLSAGARDDQAAGTADAAA